MQTWLVLVATPLVAAVQTWLVLVATPLVAALIGYGTKLLAVGMMFRPLTFTGLRPPFGWQGAVPRHAEHIAAVAAELLTTRLVDPHEMFAAVDADRLRAEVEQPLLRAIDHITRDVLAEQHAGVWESLPPMAQELAVKRLQAAAPSIVRQLVDGLRDNAGALVDLKQIAVRQLAADPKGLTQTIRELAAPDLRFLARTGLVTGFAIGLVQAVVWALTRQPWLMPLFGAAVGFGTGWLAIRLVFWPREPRRVLGFTLHGSFHRRCAAVARQYGRLIATEVLTPRNLVQELLTGPGANRAAELIAGVVDRVVDEQTRAFRPLVSATISDERLAELKRSAAARVLSQLAETSRGADGYLTDAMDIARMVEDNIRELTPREYEALLRPAIQPEEWKLIAVGGVLGAVVGELQVLLTLA